MKASLLIVSALVLFAVGSLANNEAIVCYHEYRTSTWPAPYRFNISNIDTGLCSHVVYAYFKLGTNNKILHPDIQRLPELRELRDRTTKSGRKGGTKAMIAIAGIGELESKRWSDMAKNQDLRTKFVQSVVELLNRFHLNGVMIDWEWPGKDDKNNYVQLLTDFRTAFKTNYILGITGAGTKGFFDAGFDVPKIDKQVDLIHVHSYDYKAPWADVKTVDHAAPLKHPNDANSEYPSSAAASLNHWVKNSATKTKLLMSIPTFGRTYTLKSKSEADPGDEATGPWPASKITQQAGFLAYYEICDLIKNHEKEWTMKYDNEYGTFYMHKDTLWISFDDQRVTKAKAEHVRNNSYGGVVVTTMGFDDFGGICNESWKYPVLRWPNRVFDSRLEPTQEPIPTTPKSGTTTPKPSDSPCKSEGKFRDKKDPTCQKYHECTKNPMGGYDDKEKYCNPNEGFDDKDQKCKDKKLMPECK